MIRKVLLVENDPEMSRVLQKDFKKYSKLFSPVFAETLSAAYGMLKKHPISLVVLDTEKSGKDSNAFLARLSEDCPDIHSIAIAVSDDTPDKATASIRKPFIVEDLAKKILDILKSEVNGGILRGTSPGTFLQLVEMEQKTCSIRLVDEKSGIQGALFFLEGEILDARLGDLHGRDAAYKLLALEGATMSIQESCTLRENKVQADLQALLLEAMRLKDEDEREREARMTQEEIDEYISAVKEEQTSPDLAIVDDTPDVVLEVTEDPVPVVSEQVRERIVQEAPTQTAQTVSSTLSVGKKSTVSQSVGDLSSTLSVIGESVLDSSAIKYLFRFIALVVLIGLAGFGYLFFTAESDKALIEEIERTRTDIRLKQEELQKRDKEIEHLYDLREISIKDNQSQATVMEYDIKISELEDKQEKIETDLDLKQKALEQQQAKLEGLKRKSLYERLADRLSELFTGK